MSDSKRLAPNDPARMSVPGDIEQQLIDEYFQKFPTQNEARMRRNFATKEAVVISTNPEAQKAIDEIYAAMAVRESREGPQAGHPLPPGLAFSWKPSSEELQLIDSFVKRFPPEDQKTIRETLLRPEAVLKSPNNPENQRLLDKIYERRRPKE